jgi:hypothetical protein
MVIKRWYNVYKNLFKIPMQKALLFIVFTFLSSKK